MRLDELIPGTEYALRRQPERVLPPHVRDERDFIRATLLDVSSPGPGEPRGARVRFEHDGVMYLRSHGHLRGMRTVNFLAGDEAWVTGLHIRCRWEDLASELATRNALERHAERRRQDLQGQADVHRSALRAIDGRVDIKDPGAARPFHLTLPVDHDQLEAILDLLSEDAAEG